MKKISIFGTRNPFCVENMQKYADSRKINVKIISAKSKRIKNKYRTMVTAQCKCGNVFERDWVHLKDTTMECQSCVNLHKIKNNTPKNLHTIEKVYKIIQHPKYVGSEDKVLVEDKNGYRGYTTSKDCKRKRKFHIFSLFDNLDNYEYNIKQCLKNNGYEYTTFVKFEYDEKTKRNPRIYLKCSCGEDFVTNISAFQCGKFVCNDCRPKSKYEIMLKDFLEENNINYIREYKLSECKDIEPLPFDFYLTEYHILIEVDGEHHTRPTQFGGISIEMATKRFEQQKKRDKIKNDYCKYNNIPLLRLSTTNQMDNGIYKEIVKEFIITHSV